MGADAAVSVPMVVGLDLSITGTGIAVTGPDGKAATSTVRTRDKDKDSRLGQIAAAVRAAAEGADLALIEGPVVRSNSAVISGMVHGVVRLELLKLGVPYATMAPASLKKMATGKGTGDKIPMALEAYKRAGLTFPDDNQCDAWWLWVAGLIHLGHPPFSLPKLQLESITKIKMEG